MTGLDLTSGHTKTYVTMSVRQAAGYNLFSTQVIWTGQWPCGMQIPWLDCPFYHQAAEVLSGLVNQTLHPTRAPSLCQLCPWSTQGPEHLYRAVLPHIPAWTQAWKYCKRQ